MIILSLRRDASSPSGTFGTLYLGPDLLCHTLEPIRPIPTGTYDVTLTQSGRVMAGTLWSPDRDGRLPLLTPTPGYTGIRIHAGNRVADTQGCILVGWDRVGSGLINSRVALTALIARLTDKAQLTII